MALANEAPIKTKDDNYSLIPKLIHFIWVGGNIPEKYIYNIHSFAIYNHDYKITLWTDSKWRFPTSLAPNNNHYYNTAYRTDAYVYQIKNLSIRNIDEICREIHSLIPETIELTRFMNLERVGIYHNMAAAADILRLYILYVYGGVYLDVDIGIYLKPICSSNALLGQLRCKHGFMYRNTFSEPEATNPSIVICDGFPLLSSQFQGNNDILASINKSALVKAMILTCLVRYKKLDERTWQIKRRPELKTKSDLVFVESKDDIEFTESKDDVKLSDLDSKDLRVFGVEEKYKGLGRTDLTTHISGPGLVCDVMEKYFSAADIVEEELSFPLDNLLVQCDANWMLKDATYSLDC